MKNAPAAAALVAALAAPASSKALVDGSCILTQHSLCDCGRCPTKPETSSSVVDNVRWQVARCKDVQVSDPVLLEESNRGYFYARPKTPGAEACMTRAIREARKDLQRIRLRSGVDPDRADGSHIVIADNQPQRHRRNR